MTTLYLHKLADGSVKAYYDKSMSTAVATWPADLSTKPTRRNK